MHGQLRDILPNIRVPTLVIAKTGDPVLAPAAARDLAARIPGARFVRRGPERGPRGPR
jgi:pimeloyl-ACP methyl ester carboxylesterase